MATPPNDDTKALFRLLVDREWHNYNEIRDAIAQLIPPGRALRKYQESLEFRRRYKYDNDPNYDSKLTEQERIEVGARSCAQITITSWKRAGALLDRGEKRGREIKVRPGWASWGIPGFEPGGEAPQAQDLPPEDQGVTQVGKEGVQAPEAETGDAQQASVADVAASWVPREDPAGDFIADEPQQVPQAAEPEPVKTELPHPVSQIGGIPVPPDSPLCCSQCGFAVGNRKVHDRWHEEQNKPETTSDLSLLNESQLKDLLHKGLVDVLDKFQASQEEWLAERFAELERHVLAQRRGHVKFVFLDE